MKKKYFLIMAAGLAVLFPASAGAISVDQTLAISNLLGRGGRFYNIAVPDFAVTVSSWSEKYELPVSSLIPGEYILVDTNDPDVCSALTLDECRSSHYFAGEIPVSIKPNASGDTGRSPSPTQAGTLSNIVKSVSDFFGVSAGAVATDTPPTDATAAVSSPAAASAQEAAASSTPAAAPVVDQESDQESTSTTTPPAIALPAPENIQPQEAPTTTQALQGGGAFSLAAAGLPGVEANKGLAVIMIMGIIFLLARILSGKDKKAKR